jgi:lipopolysaccharide/colanic/teichoic acid biosynthesis glycosyltransferase
MAAPASNAFEFDAQPYRQLDTFQPSKWCKSFGKRVFDIVVAVLLLLCVLPLFPVIALLIKLTSPGPVLFIHERVGCGGKVFRMLKFRTMTHVKAGNFTVLTRNGDQRVTELGWYLRRWKLDELPQLFNVIRGDMSFIGPRPHMARLLGNSPELRHFLALRPGITGFATMLFRHEENTLPRLSGEALETFYISNVLPEKIHMELRYAENASLASDLLIILRTADQIFSRKKEESALRTSRSIVAHYAKLPRCVLTFPGRLRRPVKRPLLWSGCLILGALAFGAELFSIFPDARPSRPQTKATRASNPKQSTPNTNSESQGEQGGNSEAIPDHTAFSSVTRPAAGAAATTVWADLKTGHYYCHGSALYGNTPDGEYLSEADAKAEHLEPAFSSTCSFSGASRKSRKR